jgi:ABC-2 type transport system ATP-binding protein
LSRYLTSDWVERSDKGFPQMTTRSPALAHTTNVADGPETVVSIAGLVKTFGSTTALDALDLQVERGEVHGFLGPNGSGKTVTIRILLGLLRADRGSVTVLGGDPWTDAVALHRRLAYVPGDVSLWPSLSGGEIIDFLLRLRGRVDGARRDELIDRFELDPRKKSRTYSKGNRQKVALIAALASDVELLILDEPTSGLDPLMESVFQQTIVEAVEGGTTVLLSSHILAEVEKLCDRVTIIREGRAVRHGTLAELRAVTRTTVTVATDEPPEGLERLGGVHALHHLDGHVRFEVDGDELDAVVRHLAPLGVRSLVSHPPTLEDLFLRLYSDGSAEVTP